ncbi:MAG: hypothetical protein PHF63_00290 [Herbinix sp.]|nr:hypothetical protein [Herbinix sp.]
MGKHNENYKKDSGFKTSQFDDDDEDDDVGYPRKKNQKEPESEMMKNLNRSWNQNREKNKDKDSLKDFFSDLKKTKDYDLSLVDTLNSHSKDIIVFYFAKSFKDRDSLIKLFQKMTKKKFAKAFKDMYKDDPENFPIEFATIFEALIRMSNSQQSDLKMDSAVSDIYIDLINNTTKKMVKKINKKTLIGKELAKDLLLVVPSPKCFGFKKDEFENSSYFKPNLALLYSRKLITKLLMQLNSSSSINKEVILNMDTNRMENLFSLLMTEHALPYVAISILCERLPREVSNEYRNLMTNMTTMALNLIESAGKTELKVILQVYMDQRDYSRKQNGGQLDPKFIKLTEIDAEKYPRITKMVNKIIEKDGQTAKALLS